MMTLRLPQSIWFYRLLQAVLLALIAWQLAGLIWHIAAPTPPARLPPPSPASNGAATDLSPLVRLFVAPAQDATAVSTLSWKLRAVVASKGSLPAVAIFQGNAPQGIAVRVGDELEPGVVLVAVEADHAVVEHQGRRAQIPLDAPPPLSGGVTAVSVSPDVEPDPVSVDTPDGSKPAKPPLTPPNMVSGLLQAEQILSRAQLATGLQRLNVAQWSAGLSDAQGGGIALDNAAAQPLAGPLGLQTGDVIRQLNGAPLGRAADISALYAAFSRDTQITLTVLRHGSLTTLRYRVQ
jgi:type II secretory pathway component PulC